MLTCFSHDLREIARNLAAEIFAPNFLGCSLDLNVQRSTAEVYPNKYLSATRWGPTIRVSNVDMTAANGQAQ